MGPVWVNWCFNFPGAYFGIRSPFDAYHTSLERSIRGLQILNEKHQSMDPCCSSFFQNMSFRASKRLWKFRTRKTAKNSKLCRNWKNKRDNGGAPSGIGGWPPISTWISLLLFLVYNMNNRSMSSMIKCRILTNIVSIWKSPMANHGHSWSNVALSQQLCQCLNEAW